jgi:hypothetical protein
VSRMNIAWTDKAPPSGRYYQITEAEAATLAGLRAGSLVAVPREPPIHVVAGATLPADEVRFVDPVTGKTLVTITNISDPAP